MIRNIGQFESVSPGAQVPLTPFSVIYAANGRGKTTLAAIMKSLSCGDPTLILNRKRLNAPHPPHVVLQMSGSPVTFENGDWSAPHPEVAVFDDAFVAENVCSGIEIGTTHRQNLHELILGAQGVALSKTLQGHVERIEERNKMLRAKQDAIPASVRGSFTVDAFCGLTEDAGIDARIEEAERRLAAARSADAIRQRSEFQSMQLPKFNLDEINAVLGRSLPNLEADAAARVREHLRKLGTDGEAWVADGVPRVGRVSRGAGSELCPFCAQALEGSPVIQHYQAYFSEAYSELKTAIRAMGQEIAGAHGGEVPAAFERAFRDIAEARDFWKAFTAVPDIHVDTAAVVRAWTAARESVLVMLRAKAAEPLEAMRLPQEVQQTVATYEIERGAAVEASDAFIACNDAINLVKEQAASAEVSALGADLVQLKAMKSRFQPAIAAQCNDYLQEKAEKAQTEAARSKAREALDHYRESIFPAYEVAINAYLGKFNAGFRLQSVSSVNNRGGSAASYSVVINSASVPLTASEGPSFRTALSAGDRNTLALAFFFASLTQDTNLSDKIVVIDDPMTSLDEHRTLTTMEVLRGLYEEVRQIIVLSHSKPFLCELWASADNNGRSAARVVRGNPGSTIDPWDVSADAVTGHDRRHALVRDYLHAADHNKEREIAASLRPILERFMRVASPEHFPPERLLGNFLRECEQKLGVPGEILSEANVRELRQLLTYANRFHHDTNPAESVRGRRPAGGRERRIVSAIDSGHYGPADGASNEAALDRGREAVDLPADDGGRCIGCTGGAAVCAERERRLQMAA